MPDDSQQPQTAPPFTPGMHVQPGPMTSACKPLGGGLILMHIEHVTGSTSLVMDDDFAQGLIEQLQTVTGGIVVPRMT